MNTYSFSNITSTKTSVKAGLLNCWKGKKSTQILSDGPHWAMELPKERAGANRKNRRPRPLGNPSECARLLLRLCQSATASFQAWNRYMRCPYGPKLIYKMVRWWNLTWSVLSMQINLFTYSCTYIYVCIYVYVQREWWFVITLVFTRFIPNPMALLLLVTR